MKPIVNKKIGDVKVTKVVENVVFYTLHFWSGSINCSYRSWIRCKCELDNFCKLYPKNCE